MIRTARFFVVIALLFSAVFMVGFVSVQKNDDERVRIILTYEKQSFVYEDKIIRPTNHLVAEEIHARRINASHEDKMSMVDTCIFSAADFKTALLYSFPLLEGKVNEVVRKINKLPIDSKIKFSPDSQCMFDITREKSGLEVDERVLYQRIYYALRRDRNVKIAVSPKIIKPKVCYSDNESLTHLRARFSTNYSASGEGRRHNIELALSRINGKVLQSGAEFSFNKTVGKRNAANGFKDAIIIRQGEYVDGVGGGVCQSSTTLYNCALLADMEITAARSHSLEPSYVWPSFDAMVSSASDLKFRNKGKQPVFIKAYGKDGRAYVEFYGESMPYKIIRRSEEVLREPPPEDEVIIDRMHKHFDKEQNIPSGTRKRVWYSKGKVKSSGYLLYYDAAGNLIEQKHLRDDTYNSTCGRVIVAP